MISKNHTRRTHQAASVRLAVLILAALTLCAVLTARPVQAAEWMQPYLEQVQEWGVMRGDGNGNLNEDRTITRAEFVTLVNRAFGYTEVGPSPFTDVNPNDWFAEDISIAHQAGYFNGTSANTASPRSPVTREQAAVLLGRCLRLQGTTGVSATTFTDVQDIGGWSRGLIQEAAELGIIQGYADGTFRPNVPITRGQMACFLVRALGTLIQEPGEQSAGGVYGNLTITTPGVKLKDTTITGNLYLTGGVGLGNLELENVTVLGKIVVCGSGEAEHGENSIILRNVTAGGLEVDSLMDQFLSIRAEGLTSIDNTIVRTSAFLEDLTEDGLGLKLIQLDGAEGALLQLAGNIKNVLNLTPRSTLQIAQGIAGVVTMDEKAVNASLLIDVDTTIKELNLDVATPVTGAGSITHLNVNAAGSNVSMLPDTIYVRPGINSTIVNKTMDNKLGNESSEDPRILAGYPAARNIAPTSAEAVFRTNKAGTIRWALTALMDGSVGEEDLINPSSNARIIRSGTINATASNTDFTTRLTGLTKEGSYYISALLEDARGRKSPVKVAAFTTPDDTAPNFAAGYPQAPILTTDVNGEQVAQIMVMTTKSCQMYYVLLPKGSTAPTAADFRSGALPGNLGYGVVTMRKNTPFLISRINSSHLQEKTDYDLYLWLNDADNGKSSAVRKITITTKDITPPNIVSLYVRSYTATSVTLAFSLDEPGTLSWAAVTQGASIQVNKENPSKADQIRIEGIMADGKVVIRKGGPVRAANGSVEYTFTVAGLQPQTTYDLYYTAKDTAGNYCVYNESIEFPLPIKTLDNEGPTVELAFNPTDPPDESGKVPDPRANSDVILEFSEQIQGVYKNGSEDVYEDFYDLYAKVLSSSGAALTQAKNDLANALYRHIKLYPGSPPTRGDPNVDEIIPLHRNTQLTSAQIAELSAWIDFREAIVEQSGGKTTIRFPGDNSQNRANQITPAIKLQSGVSYFFRLEGIEDTSGNPMKSPTNVAYTSRFTTAYAIIHLKEEEDILSITLPDGSVSNTVKVFSATPEGTEAVPANTRWDMVIWTSSNMRYKLYIRAAGASEWIELGRNQNQGRGQEITPVPTSGNPRVYNSLNGYFKDDLLATGLVGTVENTADYPYLNQFREGTTLEFAIVPVEGTYTSSVTLQVQVYAGTNANIQTVARRQGTAIGTNVSNINEPAPYLPLTFGKPDRTPSVYVPEDGVQNLGSSTADVQVVVDDAGIVYYMAVPLGNVSLNGNGRPTTTTGYTIAELIPLYEGNRLSLTLVPLAGVDRDPLTLDKGAPDAYNIATDNPVLQSPNSTKTGNSGQRLMGTARGTILELRDLTPETTYLLYLVPANTDSQPAEQALCYLFTTGPAEPPAITVRPNGTTAATIEVTPQSKLSYVLVNSSYFNSNSFPSLIFNRAFTGGGKNPLPAGWSGTVLDAMLETYPGTNHTVFDMCATTNDQTAVQEAIKSYTNIFVDPPPAQTDELYNVTSTGQIGFTGMVGGNYYTLLVVAEDDSGNLGFRASQTYYNSAASYLYVTGLSLGGETITGLTDSFKGSIRITFSGGLYYRQFVSAENKEYQRPVDSCYGDESGSHPTYVNELDVYLSSNNYVRLQDVFALVDDHLEIQTPKLDKNNHDKPMGSTLVFGVKNDGVNNGIVAGDANSATTVVSFKGQLCDYNGRVRSGAPTLKIELYKTPISDTQVQWKVRVADSSSTWESQTG